MQSQRNTVYNVAWYFDVSDNTKGPLTILPALEDATKGWSNVNDQTYIAGTTVFKTNAYTNCNFNLAECTENVYSLPERTAKARMITVQEAVILGCTTSSVSCPIWMNNYLSGSTYYGGTVDDSLAAGYWTMSVSYGRAWHVFYPGTLIANDVSSEEGARAVIEVSK